MSTTIYRIEHKETITKESNITEINVGPYQTSFEGQTEMINSHSKDSFYDITSSHPSLITDIIVSNVRDYTEYYCGCNTRKSLTKWFYGFMGILKANDFVVVEYLVKDILMGQSGKQCFFRAEDIISKKVVN